MEKSTTIFVFLFFPKKTNVDNLDSIILSIFFVDILLKLNRCIELILSFVFSFLTLLN